jgi:N-acetylmuramic acid 6-phosphate etherase
MNKYEMKHITQPNRDKTLNNSNMADFNKVTEQPSQYRYLEKMSIPDLLTNMNNEDKQVPVAVEKAIPQIEKLVAAITDKMLAGGRLFYIGAGTSGRLGILDASEIPPTYGLPQGLVIGIIAGGDIAIQRPVEQAEDSWEQGWLDLQKHNVDDKDVVIGIAASGTTPYVIGALNEARKLGITTGCITCNTGSPLAEAAELPVEVVVGPEFVTGSTRMKSGTAQKLVLNMISTAVMIQIGRVEDNKMVNMQLTNSKLVDRGTKMVMEKTGITDYNKARELLLKYGSVKKAVDSLK